MKYRNPLAVIALSFITLGIYSIVWCFKTREELEDQGCSVPTPWLMFIPFVGIYWMWRFSEAVEEISDGRSSALTYFILLLLLGPIGQAIIQSEFNRIPPVMLESDDVRITIERVRA